MIATPGVWRIPRSQPEYPIGAKPIASENPIYPSVSQKFRGRAFRRTLRNQRRPNILSYRQRGHILVVNKLLGHRTTKNYTAFPRRGHLAFGAWQTARSFAMFRFNRA